MLPKILNMSRITSINYITADLIYRQEFYHLQSMICSFMICICIFMILTKDKNTKNPQKQNMLLYTDLFCTFYRPEKKVKILTKN